ncbi:thioesterase family protein [Arthrobacter castelli]|uniref:thioesterase family protein n=1 Tax=Arthrobacter castelli TaxID=271431 RepID=UPI00041B0B3A|nr:thioesterase family protein [Arthrobacter castelli]
MTTAAHGMGAALPPYECTVLDEWIDYNGHMSEAFYVLVFGYATDAAMEALGMDATYRKDTGASLYTVEAHVRYLAETGAGAPLTVTTTIAGSAAKKLHLAHEMYSHPVVDQASAVSMRRGAPYSTTAPVVDQASASERVETRAETGTLIATEELLALHVDSTTGRTSGFPQTIEANIDSFTQQAVHTPPPDWVGRSVSL